MSYTLDKAVPPEEGPHASQNGTAATGTAATGTAATGTANSSTTLNDVPPTTKGSSKQTTEPRRLTESSLPAKSARDSREGSPVRPQPKQPLLGQTPRSRSRKNSQELSPSRSITMSSSFVSIPSAAAVQRALSASKSPITAATVDGVLDGSRSDMQTKSGDNSPHWPISPRLRSPPPSSSTSRSSIPILLRKADSDSTAATAPLRRSAAASTSDVSDYFQAKDAERDDLHLRTGLRTPAWGVSANASGLETVAEGSLPNTPAIGPLLYVSDEHSAEGTKLDGRESDPPKQSDTSSTADKVGGGTDGSNDNADKADASSKTTTTTAAAAAAATASRPTSSLAKRSFTNLALAKNRPALETMRSMTVETETVSALPQVVLGANTERGASGRMASANSVRPRPSSETIKAKKEKKKSTRKPGSLHSGTISSKADIFEAKVASAIDETNSSDSEETFVYESNPAERNSRHAHHSRTPSATSLASQLDQYGARNKVNGRDGSHGVAAKKSMKFTNNAYHHNLDGEIGPQGSTRSSVRNGSATPRHHHIGRHGRGGHASLFDADSPFMPANRASSPRTATGNGGKLSRPNSPRTAGGRLVGSPKKSEVYAYDLEGEAADDERTPLVGSVRASRSRHSRRPFNPSHRLSDHQDEEERRCCSRYGACVIVTLLLLVLCVGAGTFIMALNKPLLDVSVRQIQNVLASEQELMLDLQVRATNPNLFSITVNELDVNVFAKSGYAGIASQCRSHSPVRWTARRMATRGGRAPHDHASGGVDKGTDPIDDPAGDPQTMLLGEILDFDSPLVFEPSPLQRRPTWSVGEVRLAKPANQTEECGSIRWERVLQHPFELHVRGVIKYQLPINSKTRSAPIDSKVQVLPKDDAIGDPHADPGANSSSVF